MHAHGPSIAAPPFPPGLPWVNATQLLMHRQRGRPVLLEFWDFCRVNSLRTLPYLKAWHRRYAQAGLLIIGVHTGGFPPSRVDDNVRQAVARLEIPWPVAIDTNLEVWDIYGNEGWPARYLWDPELILHSLHYGEGGYEQTEREIQALLGVERDPLAPLRPEDAPGALLTPQTPDQPGAYSGPYAAGGVWAVVDGEGQLTVNGRALAVRGPGCVALIEHPRHTAGMLDLRATPGVTVYATCFTPGLAG